MKINYCFNRFDYFNNYYFYDGSNYFEVSKNISSKEYYDLNSKYYQKVDLPIYEFLFENKKFPYKNNYYKFLVIEINSEDKNLKVYLLNFLGDLLGKVDVMELKNKIICFYYKEDNIIDLKSILKAVADDLGLRMKVYHSGKLDIKKHKGFYVLFESYLKYSINSSRLYTSNSDLILDIAKKNINELKVIKPYILNSVYKNEQLEKLINSMFENNLNVTKTAKDIYMHRNTINNKLAFIEQETTMTLQKFKDAVAMYLLLKS